MRKLLLFFLGVLASVTANAADPVLTTEDDGKTLVITSDNADDYKAWIVDHMATDVNGKGYTKVKFVGSFGQFRYLVGGDLYPGSMDELNIPVMDVTGVNDMNGSRDMNNNNVKAVVYSSTSGITAINTRTDLPHDDLILVDKTTGTATAALGGNGALAQVMDNLGVNLKRLTVTGTLNSADGAVLNATNVDLSGVTNMSASLSDLKGTAEYVVLPNGYDAETIGSSLSTANFPNIKTAGSFETLTGQDVPGYGEKVVETSTTVKKYYEQDTETEFTGEKWQDNGSWKGNKVTTTELSVADGTLTYESTSAKYTNDWNDNKAYDATGLTVTDGRVTPATFDIKLSVEWYTDEAKTQRDWGTPQQDEDGYYFTVWENGVQVRKTAYPKYVYNDKTDYQNKEYTGEVTVVDGNYIGTYDNSEGKISFPVSTTYTYSYTDCDNNNATVDSQQELTTYNLNCTTVIDLDEKEITTTTTTTTQEAMTLKDQTINQFSVYVFQEETVQDFTKLYDAYNYRQGLFTEDQLNAIDKVCMAGPSLGRKDLVDVNGNAIFLRAHYFDFTGATFKDITENITSVQPYNGTWNNGQMGDEKKITETATNAFYYFKQYAGQVFSCVLPTGNTEIPPQTFYTGSGTTWHSMGSPLIEITIPDTYTKIGFEAFHLTHIQTLNIPGSITNVGEGAFDGCEELTEVTMDASDSKCDFGEKSFMGCKKLKFFTMAEGVTGIPYQMFSTCAALEQIRIPSTCTHIDDLAFEWCTDLHAVTLPEGVEKLEHLVFTGSGLADIYVMATSFDKIPKIYDCGVSQTNKKYGTFGMKDLNGNNTAPDNRLDKRYDNNEKEDSEIYTKRDYFDTTTEEARTRYQEEFSGGGYLGSGNCLVYLHFPDDMKWFYDGVPGFSNVNGVSDLHTYDEAMGNNYPQSGHKWNGSTTSTTWDYSKFDYFSDGYMWTDKNSQHSTEEDAKDRTWPSQTDMNVRLSTGGTSTAWNETVQSQYGWRQFSLMNGIASDGLESFSKKYDDTWYTMCFPWRMTDRQLFDAFNQKCEITEFKGVEVYKTGDYEYSLLLHFNEVAGTYYLDAKDNEYDRESDGTYEVTTGSGAKVNVNKYKYTPKAGGETVTLSISADGKGNDLTAAQKEMNALYYQIENVMVIQGHPYMIHPSIGAKPGSPATCTINGVVRKATTDAELEALENAGKQERTAKESDATTDFSSPLGGGGKYTFRGYLGRGIEAYGYDLANDKSNIPVGSYFLGVEPDNFYPKYYRKTSGGVNKWNVYTAIIEPDQNAKDNIEALDGHAVTASANVVFGDWEEVSTTEIDEIIAEAEEKGQEVRKVNLNIVYNINGQVVRTDGNIEGLPRGLYIVNGKKYMVK